METNEVEKAGTSSFVRKCEICVDKEAKYKCPGCSIRTCSLPCVKRHKIEKQCDGKRCATKYVSIKNFNENHLFSDYRFLENASRCSSNASRGFKYNRKFQRNRHLDTFFNKARARGVRLFLMPKGMSKRKENSSMFNYREKCLFWRVKLVFANEDAEYIIPTVNEKTTLKEVLKKYIHPEESEPIIRFRLQSYTNAWFDDVRIYMKRERTTNNRYDVIDGLQPLQECLRHKTVVEYPTFHVSISGKDFQFIQTNEEQNNDALS